MSVASRPPNSFGHETTANRFAKSFFSHSTCSANPSRVSPEGSGSFGTFARSQSRHSLRKASSFSVNVRSTMPSCEKVDGKRSCRKSVERLFRYTHHARDELRDRRKLFDYTDDLARRQDAGFFFAVDHRGLREHRRV